jgi:hypothetical protein
VLEEDADAEGRIRHSLTAGERRKRRLAGVSDVAMSLFISDPGFKAGRLEDAARLGILVASLIAGVVGYSFLSRESPPLKFWG